jgi:hypothetical protein
MERENGKLMKLKLSKLVQPLHVWMDNKLKEFYKNKFEQYVNQSSYSSFGRP